ncbi:MAG TPA: hypothetical protein VLF90_01020 [Patescibacteria group bacterium]|nr:hypothetical protein [Patescibacteria group bacterium]
MKKIKYVLATTGLMFALVTSVVLPKMVSATPEVENKVTICHRTNSVTNPYVRITVDASAVDGQGNNDHTHHTGPVATSEEVAQALKDSKTKWGDIIPDAADGGVGAGLNWDSVGQAVFNNNCGIGDHSQPTEVVPAAVTFTQPTCDALGSYTIPTTENVEYDVNGQAVAAGTYTAQNDTTVTVVAEASEGHFIGDDVTDTFTNTFTAPTNCGHVLSAQVTVAPTGGVSAGAGGASSASTTTLLGLAGSIATVAVGFVLRRKFTA